MKVEEIISLVSSVPIVAFVLHTILFALCDSYLPKNFFVFLYYILGLLVLSIIPIAPILLYSKKGEVDIYVSEREKRFTFYTWAVFVYFLGFLYFYFVGFFAVSVFVLCYATVTASLLLANYYTKVSVHVAGIAGPLTYLVFFLGSIWSLAYLSVLPVAWARYRMNAHNPFQLLLGFLISLSVTLATIDFASNFLPLVVCS